ncbi:sigma-70 family RNA polymerase sigma factor [Streptomyces canus]|uniref:sigma-70 family RNA polymerase sigma factor n=1 Tax=Streptomyces canus TaxID=58343 RepID=UPI003711C5AF
MTDQPARVPAQASPSATAAYVRIYEEEQPRLVAYARSLTRNTWAAEDLVAEAHFRVWRRLAAGHEIDNVPAYLMTTVRHLASSVASATHETPRDPQIPEQASSGHVDDPAERVSSTDLLVRVLGELPERWVQALWLADAEGQPLESVGRQIGAKQGATAVLLHRAREGMRQAFLRSQTEAPDDPACEVHWVRMPAYVRGNATPRQSERLLAHVDACDGCRGRLAVLIRANNRLPALVGPALLVFVVGGGGTGKFVASLTAGSAGAASVTGQGTGQGLLHTARAAGPKAKAALASGTAAAAAIAVVLALGVNDSPATVTSPGKAPVAQGPLAQAPVAGPSAGVAEETPGGAARQVERDRSDGLGVVVTEDVGGTENSGDSGSASGSLDGGGGEGDPRAPEQPAPQVPDPGPGPVEPAPGGEEPEPPADPEPTPPKEQLPEQPKPVQPEPEQPKPEQPKPGKPGEEPPVPEPSAPTPPDPDPVGETPEPPTYSEPPTAPESPEPSDPSESPAPEPPEPPTPGDDCGQEPAPETPAPGTSAPDKGVEPKHV